MLTLAQFKAVFPNCKKPDEIFEVLVDKLQEYNITSTKEVACFLAQCGHESGEFNHFVENLNYSAEALCKVWSKRFPTLESAKPYHRNPEKIANKVYCNRMGNGDEESGDGWKHRGYGLIQLTGKENQEKFAKWLDLSLDEAVEYLQTIEGAVVSAIFFWQLHNLAELAESDQITKMTQVINGGTNGLEDRKAKWSKLKSLL